MKFDNNTLLIGGVIVAAIAVWYLLMGNGPNANSPLGEFINRMEGRKTPPPRWSRNPPEDAMYAGYY